MRLLLLLTLTVRCCLLNFVPHYWPVPGFEIFPFVLQARVMSSFGKLMEWSLKNDEVAAGHTSSLAAAVLLLASEAQQVTSRALPNNQSLLQFHPVSMYDGIGVLRGA